MKHSLLLLLCRWFLKMYMEETIFTGPHPHGTAQYWNKQLKNAFNIHIWVNTYMKNTNHRFYINTSIVVKWSITEPFKIIRCSPNLKCVFNEQVNSRFDHFYTIRCNRKYVGIIWMYMERPHLASWTLRGWTKVGYGDHSYINNTKNSKNGIYIKQVCWILVEGLFKPSQRP